MNAPAGVTLPVTFWRGVGSLCRFDLRRFRVLTAIVVGLELLRAVMVEWLLHHSTLSVDLWLAGDGDVEFQTFDTLLRIAMIVMTALLIQADHPTDDRAFLRSRPVSPWQVAIAKLTFLAALFIVWPTAVNAVRLFAYGAPGASLIASAIRFAVIGGGVLVPAAALALFTRTLPRFIAVAIGLTVAWLTAIAIMVAYRPVAVAAVRWLGEDWIEEARVAPPIPDWQRLDRRGWTFALLMTLGGTACVVGCYRTRRPLLPAAAALALVALPSVLPEPASDPAPGVATGPLGLVAPLRLPPRFSLSTRLVTPVSLSAQLQLPQRPSHVTTTLLLGRVRVAAGSFTPIATGLPYCCDRDGGSPAAALAAAWGAAPPDTKLTPDPGFAFLVSDTDAARLRDRVVDVDAPARLRFMRHDLVGDVPLRAGQSFRTPHFLVEIVDIDARTKTALCRIARFPSLTTRVGVSFYVGNRRNLVVEAVPWWRVDSSLGGRTVIGGGRGRTWVALVTLPLAHIDAARPDARLYLVESRPAGELRTTIVGRGLRVIQPATDADDLTR
jgi:hypothetical protein